MVYNDKDFKFNDNIKEVVANNIRKCRIEKNMTQEELAVYTERSYEFIRRIESEHGQRGFSVVTLHRIATVLGVDMNALFKE